MQQIEAMAPRYAEEQAADRQEAQPQLRQSRGTCDEPVVDRIAVRMTRLNEVIATDPNLGKDYCIGHSYFTPGSVDASGENFAERWYLRVIQSEIAPLLAEYWFDNPQVAKDRGESRSRAIGYAGGDCHQSDGVSGSREPSVRHAVHAPPPLGPDGRSGSAASRPSRVRDGSARSRTRRERRRRRSTTSGVTRVQPAGATSPLHRVEPHRSLAVASRRLDCRL
ncbi:hypothetical protein E143388_03281 [Rhodococcus opacus]|nr:hypothetical protein E143388_03281 [Rhodococcus opacus]